MLAYHWKSCLRCDFIANEFISTGYLSNWEGCYGADDFMEACQQFCEQFLCKYCTAYDAHNRCDNIDKCYDKIAIVLRYCELSEELKDNSKPHSYITNPFVFTLHPRQQPLLQIPGELKEEHHVGKD